MQSAVRGIEMIKSMTGFGRCEITEGDRKYTVEMKSVNHRYLDVNIKMPKKLSFFESSIRNELKNYAQRGKIDMFITYEDFSESNICIKYNKDIAAEYLGYLKSMAEDFGLDNDIRVSSLSRYPEVFSMEEQTIDEEEIWNGLVKAVKGAAQSFADTRIKEGENLSKDLIFKLDAMLEHVAFIEERSPQLIDEYKKKLYEKVQDFLRGHKSALLKSGATLGDLIRRPELDYEMLAPLDEDRPDLPADIREQVNIHIKYEGYINRQKKQVQQFEKLEKKLLPEDIDYEKIPNLRIEARQKLSLFRPVSLGQASRISGVSPSDISVLMVYLMTQ